MLVYKNHPQIFLNLKYPQCKNPEAISFPPACKFLMIPKNACIPSIGVQAIFKKLQNNVEKSSLYIWSECYHSEGSPETEGNIATSADSWWIFKFLR